MLKKQLKQILLSFITLLLAIISNINIPALLAQTMPAKANSPPDDATCYFAGPVPDRKTQLEDLQNSLAIIKKLYEEGKITEETYLKRKEDINKKLEKLQN